VERIIVSKKLLGLLCELFSAHHGALDVAQKGIHDLIESQHP
jgi:hypothetical protein